MGEIQEYRIAEHHFLAQPTQSDGEIGDCPWTGRLTPAAHHLVEIIDHYTLLIDVSRCLGAKTLPPTHNSKFANVLSLLYCAFPYLLTTCTVEYFNVKTCE